MEYRAFVAFSGGGAKGIVHVGALKALEDRQVQFVGLAGTSAGSILATLAAAGFTAEDLINTKNGQTIFSRLSEIDPTLRHVTDLFGPGGWVRIRFFRLLLTQPLPLWLILLLFWSFPAVAGAIAWNYFPAHKVSVLLGAWLAPGIVAVLLYRYLVGGLASIEKFQRALNKLLQEKMFPAEPNRIVKMSDFGVSGRPLLKIVSANLSTQKLHLFSSERTPTTPVSDAVAASICLPVVFTPWFIDGELHIDGGIVSNLPAWPFDEERELDPEALTIAVEIAQTTDLKTLGSREWLPAAVQTTLNGSAELNLRVSGPAEQLALATRLGLLDFDIDSATAVREVLDVAAVAGLRLDKRLFRLPEIYRNACQVAQALAVDGLELNPVPQKDKPRVRVAVGRLERGYTQSLRLSHSVGYEGDADECMLVPLIGSVAGAAWTSRQSLVELYPLSPDKDLPGSANRLRRKSRWSELTWVMCIPILDQEGGAPKLLVQIDGNSALEQNEETLAALNSVEVAVKDFFNLVWHELRELEVSNGTEK